MLQQRKHSKGTIKYESEIWRTVFEVRPFLLKAELKQNELAEGKSNGAKSKSEYH
jgi:hypothetical protein